MTSFRALIIDFIIYLFIYLYIYIHFFSPSYKTHKNKHKKEIRKNNKNNNRKQLKSIASPNYIKWNLHNEISSLSLIRLFAIILLYTRHNTQQKTFNAKEEKRRNLVFFLLNTRPKNKRQIFALDNA